MRSMLHGTDVGPLPLHSHVGGDVVLLQVSAFSKQCDSSKQEHPGCKGLSVILMHTLPASHGEFIGGFALHSQVGGDVVLLQVSALSRQCKASKHEHAGCSGRSVRFKHTLSVSHGPKVGELFSQTQVEGYMVVLQASALS